MQPVSFAGKAFATYNLRSRQLIDGGPPGPSGAALVLPRGELPPLPIGVDRAARELTIHIEPIGDAKAFRTSVMTYLGAIDPSNDSARALVFRLDADSNGVPETEAQVNAAFVTWNWVRDGVLASLTFSIADATWRSASTETDSASFTANGNLAVANSGLADAYPTFTITPTANTGRSGNETAAIGWKYRRAIGPITNNSDEDWYEVLIPVWLGDTTGWVSGSKALSSGNDVRVWDASGHVVRRELQAWNSLASMLIFTATIPAGESATYWLVYGNPQASTVYASDPEYLDLSTRGGNRDGYAAPDYWSTSVSADTGSTTTVVNVAGSPGWEVDRLIGGWAWIVAGTGASNHAIRRISDSTASTFTVDDAFPTAPDATSTVIIWMSGTAMEGIVPTAATSTTITDSSKLWATDQWQFGYAYIESGTGSGQTREVTTNTGTVITTAAWSVTPDTTSRVRLIKPGYQQYMVNRAIFDTDWRGLWRISNFYESPRHKPRYGNRCPGAWTPFARYINEDNYAQPSSNDYGSGGGHSQNWFSNGRIRRQVRQDRHYGEHKMADGFRLVDPRGIDLVTFDYQWKNVDGICRFAFSAQTGDAVDFMDLVTNSTTQASLTDVAVQSVNLTDYDDPVTTICFNVGPADQVLIPNETDFASEAEFRTKTIMRVWVSPNLMGGRDATYGYITVGAETEGYDVNTRLSLNGRIVQLGGAGRHLLMALNDDLVVRCDPDTVLPWCATYDTGVLQEWAGHAVRFLEEQTDMESATVERVATKMLTIPPGASNVAVSETAIGSIDVAATWYPSYLG